ncbi:prolyl-tRNA synthetase [Nannizzia gypsea CBS 118893]|uniref:proline--tRNA ligase n=1 Tax=Arthroderma gypseum (strain ATCC MYA-4604 / CBS 118893) TaxID=535722 RepID=E4UT78_ARTGP|nr:prolyl-tRNA synthetase [Nannizzia gypsea CBS 118893]EFR01474.1 prolyl-tRNA synthetase [Nannizzia gypsea CBS 118893]
MFLHSGLKRGPKSLHLRPVLNILRARQPARLQKYHDDTRNRASSFWVPSGGIAESKNGVDSNDLLIRAGFLRQPYSGVFHLLPLGLRVQEKLERLIDKHMRKLSASKLSLSSLSSQALWKKSGRLHNDDSEVFRFVDRKKTPFLLAPTHEEEITTLVSGLIKSYRDLPLRVYQISRKYRDEPRPRHGLLRGREFVMKDLYTFDSTEGEAIKTYNTVKDAYISLFKELKIPYVVASASSGNMGGNLSHEFHFPSPKGEDTVVSCSKCEYVFNEELASGKSSNKLTENKPEIDASTDGLGRQEAAAISTGQWTVISKDKKVLVRAFYPKFLITNGESEPAQREVNQHSLKAIASAYGIDIDIGVKDPLATWKAEIQKQPQTSEQDIRVLDIYDSRVRVYNRPPIKDLLDGIPSNSLNIQSSLLDRFPGTDDCLDLLRARAGDECPSCGSPSLKIDQSIELAHTFHLGTRYSDVLQANVSINPAILANAGQKGKQEPVPIQMGCHGIGVSRMISAVSDILADEKGLNWPQAIAPFQVAVVPGKGLEKEAELVYDVVTRNTQQPIDTILDDRKKDFAWKLRDADLIGYPVILAVGKNSWSAGNKVEVQCRRLGNLRTKISLEEVPELVSSLLSKL